MLTCELQKKSKLTVFILLCLHASLLFIACEQEADLRLDKQYSSGIFILNEGPFQNGSGSITFWDRDSKAVHDNIFSTANDGELIGNILQSMTFHNQSAYLVVNNGGKILVTDHETFKKKGEILNLVQPRYLLPVSDDRAFVSQWGADGLTGSLAVVNLTTRSVEKTIPLGVGPEQMLRVGNLLYVANSGGIGGIDSTLTVIDIAAETVVGQIPTGINPNSLQFDKNGDIWVACAGYIDWADPLSPLNASGKLVRLQEGVAVETLTLPGQAYDLIASPDKGQLFFLNSNYGGAVFQFKPGETPSPALSGTFYAIDIDPVGPYLLAADARDFQSTGVVHLFDFAGQEKMTITAGIIPGGFLAR
jgi:DNA-binding beta-propeller fold protein YncE